KAALVQAQLDVLDRRAAAHDADLHVAGEDDPIAPVGGDGDLALETAEARGAVVDVGEVELALSCQGDAAGVDLDGACEVLRLAAKLAGQLPLPAQRLEPEFVGDGETVGQLQRED